MQNKNAIVDAKNFWDAQHLFVKHLLATLACFLAIPVVIVLGKLGLREAAMVLMVATGVLAFWAMGFWYVLRGAWRVFNALI
jgi:predicted PurR-regulated permease PerM